MYAPLSVPGLGPATHCVVSSTHKAPATLVYVWHHVQPQSCGGATTPNNLVSLCDNCHRTVHVLLYVLKVGKPFPDFWGLRTQKLIAERGYTACVTAGTVDQIPNEGLPAAGLPV